MLKLYNDTVASYLIVNRSSGFNGKADRISNYRGREAISQEYNLFCSYIAQHKRREKLPNKRREKLPIEISEYYPTFLLYQFKKLDLNPYFRTIYNILKYIEGSSIEEKKRYTNLLRAQISDYELGFIFYNCQCSFGKKMKPLVDKYEILKHLPQKIIIE